MSSYRIVTSSLIKIAALRFKGIGNDGKENELRKPCCSDYEERKYRDEKRMRQLRTVCNHGQ
ncbi:hypothetical protein N9Y42_08695 [Mariniblastus sp.]|nr:hypothetical protein [Mariniblastus sp.]